MWDVDSMINKMGLVSVFIGIIGIFLFIDANYLAPVKTNRYHMTRGIVYGGLAIVFGIYMIHAKSDQDEAEIFNFTETDSKINCMNCKYCDMTLFDGYEADCKFFKIKVDQDHICDLGKPAPKIKVKKFEHIDSGKRIV